MLEEQKMYISDADKATIVHFTVKDCYFMTHLVKIEGGAKIIVHKNFTAYPVICTHNQHHTWPSLNWSPPKADTHGLIPPVPRAIITKPRAASALEEKH